MNSGSNRSVIRLIYASIVDMGGFPVRQPLPVKGVDQIDPFLLLHHAEVKVPEDRDPGTAGIGPHPHRGFSPVTFVINGEVHHRDSWGNNQTLPITSMCQNLRFLFSFQKINWLSIS